MGVCVDRGPSDSPGWGGWVSVVLLPHGQPAGCRWQHMEQRVRASLSSSVQPQGPGKRGRKEGRRDKRIWRRDATERGGKGCP